ncbi:MAG TPA: energy transducer TonB [Terracidiphilus sp.]|nr:energy transducer TonB [Terracidiphilus sp.]
MHKLNDVLQAESVGLKPIGFFAVAFGIYLAAATGSAPGQTSASQPAGAATNPLLRAGAFSVQTADGEIQEDQLKQLLVGKTLYLRSGYLDNNLEFDEWGRLTNRSPQGSFTLNEIQIGKVKLSRHRLELEGDRYGLHFPGATPNEDPSSATNKVKITPKKKTVRISFDRERVEIPKKKKGKNEADASGEQRTPRTAPANAASTQLVDQPPRDNKATTTTSPAHSSQMLLAALDKVFSYGIDDRMVKSMPDFWKLYFQAVAAKQDYKPDDPGVYRQNNVDQKARLISTLDPPSNEFAQANEVAGMALYHAVVGSDGKVEKVVVARPIGFGLDENAEQTIQKAVFQPAVKAGKPVPVALDLVVSFRIYSKRTSQLTQETDGGHTRVLPGPYTVQEQPQATQQPQPSQSPQ